jgi:hypothetical protein
MDSKLLPDRRCQTARLFQDEGHLLRLGHRAKGFLQADTHWNASAAVVGVIIGSTPSKEE